MWLWLSCNVSSTCICVCCAYVYVSLCLHEKALVWYACFGLISLLCWLHHVCDFISLPTEKSTSSKASSQSPASVKNAAYLGAFVCGLACTNQHTIVLFEVQSLTHTHSPPHLYLLHRFLSFCGSCGFSRTTFSTTRTFYCTSWVTFCWACSRTCTYLCQLGLPTLRFLGVCSLVHTHTHMLVFYSLINRAYVGMFT